MTSAQIRACGAEAVLELLNSHDQEFTFNQLVEILKQRALHEAEEPQSEPKFEPKEKTMAVSKRLELSEAGTKEFKDTDSNGQRTKTSVHGIMRNLACCEDIRKEKRSFSKQTLVPDQVTFRDSCVAACIVGHDDPDGLPVFQEEVPSP